MKNNKTKITAIVALMVAVVGLGIGFAAFSSQLTISSGATVTPNASDWNVGFNPTFGMSAEGYFCMSGNVISTPTIDGTTISGLEVAFSNPGEGSAHCIFQIQNLGKYNAYLTKVEFVEETLSCEALEESDEKFPEGYTRADDSLVAEACKGIEARYTFANSNVNINGDNSIVSNNIWTINDISGDDDISNYTLESDSNTPVNITILYNQTAARADGPFVVRIPDIKLTYSTTPTLQ